MLRDGELVTVDGTQGVVLAGDVAAGASRPPRAAPAERAPSPACTEPLATRLYVNLAIADQAEQVAALPVDGVGLLRAEFMVTDALDGVHPRALLARGGARELPRRDGGVAAAHHDARSRRGRSCTARSTSARNEFRGLEGGDRVRADRGRTR